MSEFKVGDKVKCINDNDPYEDLIKGEIYSVVDVHDADGRIYISVDGRFRRRDNFSKNWFRDPHLFALVSETDNTDRRFQIGDKVKCINSDDDQYDDLIKGEIYTVVETYGANMLQVDGKFRGEDDGSANWRLSVHFELVEEDQDSLFTPLLLALGSTILKHLLAKR